MCTDIQCWDCIPLYLYTKLFQFLFRSGEFGRFRIEIQRDSFWQAAVTIYNNLRSYASPRTISITKLSRSKSRSSWTMACHRRSWLFMAPFGLSPQKFEFPLHFSPGDVYEVTVSDQSTDSSYRRIAHFRAGSSSKLIQSKLALSCLIQSDRGNLFN